MLEGAIGNTGLSWPWVRDLQESFNKGFNFAEPSIVSNNNGNRAHITYTSSFYDEEWGMKRQSKIMYMSITEEWVKGEWKTGVSSVGEFKGDVHKRPGVHFRAQSPPQTVG